MNEVVRIVLHKGLRQAFNEKAVIGIKTSVTVDEGVDAVIIRILSVRDSMKSQRTIKHNLIIAPE